MARPQKHTVDYFSHDANASQGKTLSIMFNNFGHDGISAWWQLLEIISNTENHVIGIRNPEELEYLAAKMRFQPEQLKKILTKLAEMDAIDKPLFEAGLLWSQNFVNRLESVYKIRKQDLPIKPELSVKETALSGKKNGLLVTETPQSKLKETKVKETKEYILPDFINKETFKSYLEMRREKKKVPTGHAIEIIIKDLTTFHSQGQDVNLILEKSIKNGWTDVYSLKDGDNGRTGTNPRRLPKVYTRPDEL
jgi:hypothetical protein